MKLSIIGGGNMGGSIVRGLVQGSIFKASDITVIDVQEAPLEALQSFNPEIKTALIDYDSISEADIIILAVKPWMINDAILDIKFKMDYKKQIVISVAAGVTIQDMNKVLNKVSEGYSLPPLFRVIPNTAISIKESTTLVATDNADSDQTDLILKIFNELGNAILIDESKIDAGTSLASCGIAYLFRYVRAATMAGVEMGFYPQEALQLVIHTMKGAADLLIKNGQNPENEIDKVATPGGLTIKGLNELEANGFSDAIIKAMKMSRK